MRLKPYLSLLPAVFLILAVTGIALAKTFLGSIGIWGDIGRSPATLANFVSISKPATSAVALSLELATVSTLLAAALGLSIAYAIHMALPFSRALAIVTSLILITPHVVAAVSFNFLLRDAGFLSRIFHSLSPIWPQFVAGPLWLATILDYGWKESAFIALVLLSSLPAKTKELQNAASTLGAKRIQVALKVLFPTVKTALIISGGLAFIYSLGSYEATWILGKTYPEPLSVLTFRLFSNSDLQLRPQAYATAVFSVLLIGIAAIAMSLLIPKRAMK